MPIDVILMRALPLKVKHYGKYRAKSRQKALAQPPRLRINYTMFFALSKIMGFLLNPIHILALLAAMTWGWKKWMLNPNAPAPRKWRRRFFYLLTGMTFIWAGCLVVPIGPYHAVKLLEDRFPNPNTADLNPAVIIILGGWQGQGQHFIGRDFPPISGAGDRLISGLMLAKSFPRATIYLPGGLTTQPGIPSEADISRAAIKGLGLDPKRFIVEDSSKNTAENAQFIEALLDHNHDQQVVLVTSAWHMPRAMGAFRAAGISPVAVPTDYLTAQPAEKMTRLFGRGHELMAVALHEWVGLIAYWATGRTNALFPSPLLAGGKLATN